MALVVLVVLVVLVTSAQWRRGTVVPQPVMRDRKKFTRMAGESLPTVIFFFLLRTSTAKAVSVSVGEDRLCAEARDLTFWSPPSQYLDTGCIVSMSTTLLYTMHLGLYTQSLDCCCLRTNCLRPGLDQAWSLGVLESIEDGPLELRSR
jgi:hypothetical protein